MKKLLIAAALAAATVAAHADAVQTLRAFVRDVKTGRAEFTQTVTSPDGARKKTSSGRFEFSRPDRFRFGYEKPFQQTIVADGQKVWIYDPDLNQVSSRRLSQALGATPAALLAGEQIRPAPEVSSGLDGGTITGIGCVKQGDAQRMLILLDIETLMRSPDMGLMDGADY